MAAKDEVPAVPRTSKSDIDQKSSNLIPAPAPVDAFEYDDDSGVGEGEEERVLQRWNRPLINRWRLATVFFAFFNFGLNDACLGALLPSLESYYGLNYTIVSLFFLSPFVGYSVVAFLSDRIHHLCGQRGVAFLAAFCRLVAYITLCIHPPWPASVAVLAICGLGTGLLDAAWNPWVGDMVNANQLLGIMHGFYGLGATISPLIATSMVNKYSLQWYEFFYVLASLSVLELGLGSIVWWSETAQTFRQKIAGNKKNRTKDALKEKIMWICCVFMFCYVGVEVSLGGWIVTFMLQVRNADPYAAGLTATGFWLAVTAGRFSLGFVTPLLGERLAVLVYITLALAFQLVFWLVPSFIVSAVSVALVGYFIGPIFPTAVVLEAKLLPKHLHTSAVGFSVAIGGAGAAVLPFAVGAIAQAKGVQNLQPIIIALLAVLLILWVLLHKISKSAKYS